VRRIHCSRLVAEARPGVSKTVDTGEKVAFKAFKAIEAAWQ
jgi:hypothetical protein